MLSKIPAISKVVVPFYELYPFAFAKAQFIRASRFKVIWMRIVSKILGVYPLGSVESLKDCVGRLHT